jgi:CRP-like cAMP-binding protein
MDKLDSGNRLLDSLSQRDLKIIAPALEIHDFDRGTVLLEPGENVLEAHFPSDGAITSLVIKLNDGKSAEAAMIGIEGALGGVISHGQKPAFARGVVEVGGPVLTISVDALDEAKLRSESLRDHFARYGDCLLAQALQSVVCNAVHDFESRLARWLLAAQDRLRGRELFVTQDFVAGMLGVRRTYATSIVGAIERRGAIRTGRGSITIIDRGELERIACDCYAYLRRHFERVLPGVYPSFGS